MTLKCEILAWWLGKFERSDVSESTSKMPMPSGRRRAKSIGVRKSTAVEDFARYSVEAV